MDRYTVTGMSCAACAARVEKAVSGVPGVESCAVSLLTNSMGVTGDASPEAVIKAVEDAGYGARLHGGSRQEGSGDPEGNREGSGLPGAGDAPPEDPSAEEALLKDTETPVLVRRLAASAVILLLLMYISMGHMMWGWPAPAVFENHVFAGLFEMVLAAAVMLINHKFFVSGFRSLFHGAPNMDTLVALGSSASFLYSLAELFIMAAAQGNGDTETVMKYGMNLYFESAAMIPALITVGKLLEAVSKGRTTDALKDLIRMAPQTAVLLNGDTEEEVPVSRVRPGDRFAVRAGSSIPVDGTVESGDAAVDESALTGESVPVDKEPGDPVSAGTISRSGYLICTASRVGGDTTLSRIIRTVADAQATKAPIARIADKVSAVFVPVVMGLALLTFIGWLVAGQEFGFAIARGISVLVISCPCALGLATPVAIMAGSGVGARNGILYRTAAALEETGRVGIIGLDKTGTVTEGSPRVTDVIPSGGCTEETLVSLAYALEKKSEHPLAKAVNLYAEEHGITAPETEAFRVLPGSGVSGNVLLDGRTVSLAAGNAAFIRKTFPGTALPDETIRSLASAGKTPLLFMLDRAMIGIIAVADTIRDDSKDAVQALDRMGIRVVMLTGDNRFTAEAIAGEAGIRDVVPGVLPDGKSEVVDYLKKAGKTAMVGDGINDAPALTAADVGLAIGAGTDVAIDAADVVLMKSRLSDVPAAVRLSRATLRNIRQNLFWAFFYNALCIPLAMGLFGIALKPMYGAAAMALSSFFVCMNALRLNLLDIHDGSRDRKRKAADADLSGFLKDPETGMAEAPGKDTDHTACGAAGNCGRAERKENMEKTLNIEGMMCMHCEARVKKALENVPGVSAADVSHEKGTAVVTLEGSVDNETLKKAVEDQGYEVKAIA